MHTNVQRIKIDSVRVVDRNNYALAFSDNVLFWSINPISGKYELQNLPYIKFDRQDLIDQCCLLKEEIKYMYLKLDSFGASILQILLQDSLMTIEQIKSINGIKTMLTGIEVTSPRKIERYAQIKAEYLSIFEMAPQDPDGVALYESAEKYFYGIGIGSNIEMAVNLYIESAEKGNVDSKEQLSYIYINGHGVKRNEIEAFRWLEEAASEGSSSARVDLADCYIAGDGVQKDFDKALDLYLYAAIQGDILAQHKLGKLYHFGMGVEKNLRNAVKWYELSDEKDKHSDNQYFLGSCYEEGDEEHGLKRDLKKAFDCYKFSAQYNNGDALLALGMCYEFGRGIESNISEAIKYYTKSIEHGGDVVAYSQLGSLYYKKQEIRDYDKAIYFLNVAAEYNLPHCQTQLAYCYYERGDKLTAWDWFIKAANNGDSMAANALNYLVFS